MTAPIQNRRGPASLWESTNYLLLRGEIGVETPLVAGDPSRFKIGDGETRWLELPYAGGNASGSGIDIGIADDLTTSDPGVALSAAQGVILKNLVNNKATLQTGSLVSDSSKAANAAAVAVAVSAVATTAAAKATLQTGTLVSDSGVAPNAAAVAAHVASQVAALVNSAPGTLDTLAELGAALGNNPNFATATAASIAAAHDAAVLAQLAADDLATAKADVLPPVTIGTGGTLSTAHLNRIATWTGLVSGAISIDTAAGANGSFYSPLNPVGSGSTLTITGASVPTGKRNTLEPGELGLFVRQGATWVSQIDAVPVNVGGASAIASITPTTGTAGTTSYTINFAAGYSGPIQWQRNTGSGWTDISGATFAVYDSATPADGGADLRAFIGPSGGIRFLTNTAHASAAVVSSATLMEDSFDVFGSGGLPGRTPAVSNVEGGVYDSNFNGGGIDIVNDTDFGGSNSLLVGGGFHGFGYPITSGQFFTASLTQHNDLTSATPSTDPTLLFVLQRRAGNFGFWLGFGPGCVVSFQNLAAGVANFASTPLSTGLLNSWTTQAVACRVWNNAGVRTATLSIGGVDVHSVPVPASVDYDGSPYSVGFGTYPGSTGNLRLKDFKLTRP